MSKIKSYSVFSTYFIDPVKNVLQSFDFGGEKTQKVFFLAVEFKKLGEELAVQCQ